MHGYERQHNQADCPLISNEIFCFEANAGAGFPRRACLRGGFRWLFRRNAGASHADHGSGLTGCAGSTTRA
jgi:hypothetical protein